jgi:hypothetical protein
VDEGRPYTVVYDGTARVCGQLVGVLRAWDARSRLLEIVPSQWPGVGERFSWIPPHAFGESLQVIGPGGRTWQRAAAVEQLLEVLPRGGAISWVFRVRSCGASPTASIAGSRAIATGWAAASTAPPTCRRASSRAAYSDAACSGAAASL